MKPLFFSLAEETCSLIHWYKNHLCKSCPQRMDHSLAALYCICCGNGKTVMNLQWLAQDFQSRISLIFTLLLILLPQINKSCFCWVACPPLHTQTHWHNQVYSHMCNLGSCMFCSGFLNIECAHIYLSYTFTVTNGVLIRPGVRKLKHESTCCYCCKLENHKLHQETGRSLFIFFLASLLQ